MSLTKAERETVISFNDEDEVAEIWTAQRPRITQLKNNPSATLVEENTHDGSAWARFTIPANCVSFRKERAKRQLSEAELERRREHGRKLGLSRKGVKK